MISDALGKVFVDAADAQSHQLVEQYAQWYQAIGDIMQAPNAGDYSRFAQSSWPVAAALAPALFLLRIALYQWNRLVGEEDSAARAAGDILTALILAVLCGWFLDLVVRLGYWMAGAAVGNRETWPSVLLNPCLWIALSRTWRTTPPHYLLCLGFFSSLWIWEHCWLWLAC